jgi:hypothetical protein
MNSPKINYISNNSIMVITNNGCIRQLFVPFKAQVILPTASLVKHAFVFIEEVQQHDKYLLLYRIANKWWPYYAFKLSVEF